MKQLALDFLGALIFYLVFALVACLVWGVAWLFEHLHIHGDYAFGMALFIIVAVFLGLIGLASYFP